MLSEQASSYYEVTRGKHHIVVPQRTLSYLRAFVRAYSMAPDVLFHDLYKIRFSAKRKGACPPLPIV